MRKKGDRTDAYEAGEPLHTAKKNYRIESVTYNEKTDKTVIVLGDPVSHIKISGRYAYPKFRKKLIGFMVENGFDLESELSSVSDKVVMELIFNERPGYNVEVSQKCTCLEAWEVALEGRETARAAKASCPAHGVSQ